MSGDAAEPMPGASAASGGPPRRKRVQVAPGLGLHVTEWGREEGWPVLILHGGAHDGSHWEAVCRRLPPALRCIVPDQRGHGASDRAPDGDYSCQAQVADLVALLDALALARCALVGHSMGGLNALHIAGNWPERVTALVLVDVGTDTGEAGLAAIAEKRRRAAAGPLPGPTTAGTRFDAKLLDFVPTYGGDERERSRLLARSSAPLLILRGEKSRVHSELAAARTAQVGRGRVVNIPGAGHNVSLHDPERVAGELRSFLLPLAEGAQGEVPFVPTTG